MIAYFSMKKGSSTVVKTKYKIEDDDILKEKDGFTQEELHAHDGIDAEKFDVTQNAVHKHDGWNSGGPIQYK